MKNKIERVINLLLEFSCSNHKSIKEQINFSAVAGKDESKENHLYNFGGLKILKNAVIYGANGSGKSNLIDAILFMKHLVINSINHQPGMAVRHTPHKLLGIQEDSTYKIQFVTKGIRYAFGFSLNKSLIVDEFLYAFPNGRQVKVYERTSETTYISGDKYKGKFDACKDVIKPNRLFLSCAANFSKVQDVENVFSFFRDDLIIYRGAGIDNWMNYSLKTMHDVPKVKSMVLSFLNMFGAHIKDINIKIEKEQIQKSDLPSFLSDEAKAQIVNSTTERVEAQVVYDTFSVDLINEESSGIKKLFEFLCPFIDILVRGKVLLCDELETNLHESILYNLVDMYGKLNLVIPSQLFFTTHDTSILSLDLFRRDQIWFTEMRRDTRSTDLYSLAEIKNVRKDENISKGYIAGKYGAIPMLNQNLASLITDIQAEAMNFNG